MSHHEDIPDPVIAEAIAALPRYVRTRETLAAKATGEPVVPPHEVDAAIAQSSLTPGSRMLVRGLLDTGGIRVFPGGGLGIEYGALLKRAWRPDVISEHVAEVGDRLRAMDIDLLIAPGNSGHPIGVAYAMSSGIPALLLAKTAIPAVTSPPPPGSFIITSYTGSEEVVISADPEATRAAVDAVLRTRSARSSQQADGPAVLRIAAVDDIIDKSTMALALIEQGPSMVRDAIRTSARRHGDDDANSDSEMRAAEVVAMVAPLMKQYTSGAPGFVQRFGFEPIVGLRVTRVQIDPPAIGVAGAGLLAFPS